jgi:ATP-dependent DNA helicase RecG
MVCVQLVPFSILLAAGCPVWVTFKRATIQAYNLTTPQPHKFTPQPHNPTTSKDNRAQKLKTFFSIIGENGANLKLLMEGMHLRDRKSFVNNYINPNLSEGYIAMLYPEIPNHPMQSYYLTKKGRVLLEQL